MSAEDEHGRDARATVGWGFASSGAKRFHYFQNGRSLCGRFGHHRLANLEERGFEAAVDCRECGEAVAAASRTERGSEGETEGMTLKQEVLL